VSPARKDLEALATGRRNRIQSNGRPRFELTDDELKRSTQTAMRLANGTGGNTICFMTTRESARTPRWTVRCRAWRGGQAHRGAPRGKRRTGDGRVAGGLAPTSVRRTCLQLGRRRRWGTAKLL